MNLNEIIEMLDAILAAPERLEVLIPKLQETIRNVESDAESPGLEILYDLAYDLEYYVADPDWRKEDPSYYGPERALEEIQLARRKLIGLNQRPNQKNAPDQKGSQVISQAVIHHRNIEGINALLQISPLHRN